MRSRDLETSFLSLWRFRHRRRSFFIENASEGQRTIKLNGASRFGDAALSQAGENVCQSGFCRRAEATKELAQEDCDGGLAKSSFSGPAGVAKFSSDVLPLLIASGMSRGFLESPNLIRAFANRRRELVQSHDVASEELEDAAAALAGP